MQSQFTYLNFIRDSVLYIFKYIILLQPFLSWQNSSNTLKKFIFTVRSDNLEQRTETSFLFNLFIEFYNINTVQNNALQV